MPVFTVDPSFCPYDYTWTISNLVSVLPGAPVTAIQQTGDKFDFLYNYELQDLTQKQTVTATATSYSDYGSKNVAKQASESFDLTFQDACLYDIFLTLTPSTQTQPSANNYNGQTVRFTYTPFTVSPNWCDMTVTCVTVEGPSEYLQCQNLDVNNKISWTFDSTDYTAGLTPGTYTYTFNV
jgi:hypothetical protein